MIQSRPMVAWGRGKDWLERVTGEYFWSDGVVLYLNCDDGHGVYKFGKTQVNVGAFYYI